MRRLVCALLFLGFAPPALAGDLDVLRGSQSVGPALFTKWSGFYGGGHYGYGDFSGDFSKATAPLIAYALRVTTLESEFSPSNWPVLGSTDNQSSMYGGFIGYNTQWQDVILGVEANYSRGKFALHAPSSPIGRITPADSDGNVWTISITGSGSVTDLQYGELRGRAGWALGNFLPYGFFGAVIGMAKFDISASGSAEANAPSSGVCSSSASPPCYFVTFDQRDQHNAFVYGFAAGTGMDVALTQNIFLRGEFEYLRFAPVNNTVLSLLDARIGAGLKF